jgi:glycosyltransferase involved in cell wall biosynthesis
MNILWVKVGGLWPAHTGGRLRSLQIVAALAERHAVTLLTTHGAGDDPEGLVAQLPGCEVVSFPHAAPKQGTAAFGRALVRSWATALPVDLLKWRVPALRDAVERRLASTTVDVCVADFLSSVPNVPLEGPVPVVFFDHNVEHVIWRRLARVGPAWRRPVLELEWRKVRRQEARTCRSARLTVAVSDVDRELLAADAPRARVAVVPTGVDTRYFSPSGTAGTPASLVFTGSMDWYPNEDAIRYFVAEILPLVRREVPAASLTVVGRRPSHPLRTLAEAAGVRVTGRVDDVRPYVSDASVYVVPLRVGGGTRLKIFEALAMAKAVVSTTVGAEGLPLVPEQHFARADTPADFAAAVVALLRDPMRRNALGAAGRRLVEERYSWPQVAREFEERCREVVAR